MANVPEPPDSPHLADEAAGWRSAYVHIPFCARVCPYCDFAVVEGREDLLDRYLAALEREIDDELPWERLDAVFFGGGTPSRVPASGLGRILEHLTRRFGLSDSPEVTLEANPEDWSEGYAHDLVRTGFTRVSFGAQSFDPTVLSALGRRHAPDQIETAVAAARAAGFGSISLDLIYGTPGESLDAWRATVARAIALEPDHVSTYALTVEPPTALGRAVRAGAPGPDPDMQADEWEAAVELLEAGGFVRYEVSNHARPGHHCRYNLAVWAHGEYLAYGLGAHGFRGGMRTRNVRRLDTYLARIEAGLGPLQGVEHVEGWVAEQERMMVGLRRAAGVRMGEGGRALLGSDAGRRLAEAGVVEVGDDRLVVTRPLLTDAVVRAVLALPAPA